MPARSIATAALTLAVSAAAGDSLVDEVQKLLDKASEARSRRVVLADRAARLYAPVVHLTAALVGGGLADRRRRRSIRP